MDFFFSYFFANLEQILGTVSEDNYEDVPFSTLWQYQSSIAVINTIA